MNKLNEGKESVEQKEELIQKINFNEAGFEDLKKVKNLEVGIEKQNLALILAEMNERLGLVGEEKMKSREGGYHLTIIDPSESGFLDIMTAKQFEKLKQISNNIADGKGVEVKGIGMIDGESSSEVRESDKNKKVCFVVIESDELNDFRESLPERIDSKGKKVKLTKKDLHITLGFVGGDIHNSNMKNEETKKYIPIRKSKDERFDDVAKMIKLEFGGIDGDKKEEKKSETPVKVEKKVMAISGQEMGLIMKNFHELGIDNSKRGEFTAILKSEGMAGLGKAGYGRQIGIIKKLLMGKWNNMIEKMEKKIDSKKIAEKLRNASEKVVLIPKKGNVDEKYIIKSLPDGKGKKIVAVDFNVFEIEKKGVPVKVGLSNEMVGYKENYQGREIINIDHHIPIDEMKRIVSSTNLACEYVKNNGIIQDEEYDVVAHHADVDSFLATLVLRGAIPPDQGIEDTAIAADHTGRDNALADFLQASQEEKKIKDANGETSYQNTFKYLSENLAKLLEKVNIDDLSKMKSRELLQLLNDNDELKIDPKMILNLESRIKKRQKVKELVERLGQKEGFKEVREGSGVYYVDVNQEIDGELAPAVFADNGINANVIVISYPNKDFPGRLATKVRLGEWGMINKLDLQKIDLNYFVRGIDKEGNKLDTPGYGGRWNAGSDKRNGGTYLNGCEYARNIDNLIRAQEDIGLFLKSLSEDEDINQDDRKSIVEAFNLMIELHISQKDRPDKKPYIVHPLEVAKVVWQDFGVKDKDVIVAALLHDSIEDQAEKLSEKNGEPESVDKIRSGLNYIGKKFGMDVARLVEELSNPDRSEEDIEKELFDLGFDVNNENFEKEKNKLKNKYYLEHVKEIIEKDPKLLMIKLADFSLNALALDNVQDPVRKAKLLAKYQPAGKLFLEKINSPDGATENLIDKFNLDKLNWLRNKLEYL